MARSPRSDSSPGDGRPSRAAMAELMMLLEPWRTLTQPVVVGLDNVPRGRPYLFVGNHTLLGVFDVPVMFYELYRRRRIILRSLGDHAHFGVPLWRDMLARYGVVDGTRENCARLMREKESILVFPGGAREVFKRKGEKYKLLWGDRVGFARLAIEHRYSIVPFAAVGAEDMWDIVLDADEIVPRLLQDVLARVGLRTDALMPIVKGIGPTPLPRPQRLYFHFARPIASRRYGGRGDDHDACWDLRERVKKSIEEGIELLLQRRCRDPDRNPLRALLRRATAP